MTATPTPLGTGTDVGETIGGKLYGRSTLHDPAGADAMGVAGATPDPVTLLGRLKAIATALAGIPTSLGIKTGAASLSVVLASDEDVATDTKLAAMSAKLPASVGPKAGAASLSIVPATDAGLASATKQDALLAATAVTLPPFPITPHATNALERAIVGLAVKVAGTVVFHHPADATGTDRTVDLPAGFYPMGGATHIRATSTAQGLTGF